MQTVKQRGVLRSDKKRAQIGQIGFCFGVG
jgi:hypothetical protein